MRSLFQAIEKHSLKFKLTAIITGLVLFISFGLSFVFLVNEFYRYKERMQKEARLVIASVGRASLPFLISANHLLLQEMIGAFRGEKNIHALWVADAQGHILAHSDPQRVGERVKGWNALRQNILQEPLLMTEDLEKGVLQVFLAVQRAGQTWGIVGLEYSAIPLRTQLTLLAGETLAVTLAFVLLGLWLGAVISARISRPLSELTRAAVRLESGVFEIDIDVDSADEVGILKQRFLKMAEALNLSQKELQQKNEALNRLNRELAWRVEEATRELRQTKDYLSYILASTREGIITTDQEGMIKTMNRAALAILGPLSTSEEPQKLWDLYPGVAGLEETFQETLRSGKVGQFQCTLRGAGQGERIVETTLTPLKDDKGMLLGGVVVLNDVTQRQRDEAELIRSEKLASVGELAAGVAHEINNSIMVILGFAQVLKREMAPQGESLDDVQTIEKEAKRCRDIVQQLLHFARPQPLKLGWYDIHEAIENSLHLLEHQITKKALRVQKDFDPALPLVFCDLSQLELVFTNMVLNAVQVLPAEEEIHIATRRQEGGYVEVIIADTGPGILPEHLPKLFDPFFTTKPPGEGTGLGLAVAYRIIEAHRGTVSVESAPGQGARFTIRLPVRQEKETTWKDQV